MTQISYFPRYSQRENIVTNNTLLMMSRLYDYNRLKFGKFLAELGDETSGIAENLDLQFTQQKGTGASVVDGFIAQESMKIVIETKLEDSNFSLDQLRRHSLAFGGENHRLLVLLSPGPTGPFRDVLEGIRQEIPTLHTTFERVLVAAEKCLSAHDEEMLAVLADFEAFCSSENLLPRDKFTMFTPPCGQSFDDNVEYDLYYCPQSWNRRASRFLGIYANKSVRRIGRITKIVACNIDIEQGTVVPDEGEIVEEECRRILGAALSARDRGWDISDNCKFYLCDEMVETDFRKISSGGIQGHRYFDLGEVLKRKELPNIAEIGELLKCRTWE
ncbi:MAG: hypothetical protein F4Z57_22875 [Gemmatimonadetes bacterium]|nr:hypothetical protein [Gemmatimonadota bacterium]MYC70017.1 hypothetical protein [Gemmatimonadota bacterium]MYI60887.1 hypothetical protein [Gemmatimonadota bacterium]